MSITLYQYIMEGLSVTILPTKDTVILRVSAVVDGAQMAMDKTISKEQLNMTGGAAEEELDAALVEMAVKILGKGSWA